MSKPTISALLLALASIIWGFAFVAQRAGMQFLGPFSFTAIRFFLGAAVTWMLLQFYREPTPSDGTRRERLLRTAFAGIALFFGATLQQSGLVSTSAGKAGFLTSLYVIFVPLIGIAFNRRTSKHNWAGAIIATFGLYLLCVKSGFKIESGDLLTLLCAVAFAAHVLLTSWTVKIVPPIRAALHQYSICAVLSLIVSAIFEVTTLQGVLSAWLPIAYGGILSVGIAYTLYTYAQKDLHPSYTAIILALEAPFAVIGGMILLGERLGARELIGCGVLIAGVIFAQKGENGKGDATLLH